MNVGFIGLGKLGLPCAMAIENAGHSVVGFDPSPQVARTLRTRTLPYREDGAAELLEKTKIQIVPVAEVVRRSEVIFVAVQTPHDPRYEGASPLPETRADFHYGHLCDAVSDVVDACIDQDVYRRTLVVISTVLPRTIRRYVQPIVDRSGGRVQLVYNPFFIAMGTCIHDFLDPEFVLIGADAGTPANDLVEVYSTLHKRPIYRTTIENAEIIKVAYNTFIGMKIVFANTLMEICHKTPNTDVDGVVDALKLATSRVIGPSYLRGGMGDGGGCHPRDNIALSWLAQKLSLSHDFFDDVMRAREDQTAWLAELIIEEKRTTNLDVVLLGWTFKPETNIDVGSPARLLSSILHDRGVAHRVVDPYTPGFEDSYASLPALYFISTKHEAWKTRTFARGSIVIDPHRYLHDNPSIAGCRYIPVGRS